MVEPRIVLIRHLGQAKVRAFARVRGDDVIDDDRVVRGGHAGQRVKLRVGAQLRVDVEADPVEIAVDRRGEFSSLQAARAFQRAIVNPLDTDFRQRVPQGFITQRFQHGALFPGDDGCRVRGEPDGRQGRSITGPRMGIGLLPQSTLPGVKPGSLPCGIQHGLLDQPGHLVLFSSRHINNYLLSG
ncbi:hypothetical protein D3C87_1419060 [compost metagenome]